LDGTVEIQNLDAALFVRVVELGEINPQGEVSYKGYRKVRFAASDTTNLEHINFPAAEDDYRDANGNMIPVMCAAALDLSGKVIAVKVL
jgi:hypothetical protein